MYIKYIQEKIRLPQSQLNSIVPRSKISSFSSKKGATEWVVDQIITDNEASSVQKALQKKGLVKLQNFSKKNRNKVITLN